ncbi:MAG: hypothetical protein Kow0075_09070 [Salibacteraceae bacterium]
MHYVCSTDMRHLDLTYIKENVTEDNDFIKELLNVFLSSLDDDCKEFFDSVDAKDHSVIRRSAHKLKSSFRSLGMDEMASIMQSIENCAFNQAPLEQINELKSRLEGLLPEVKDEVREMLSRLD